MKLLVIDGNSIVNRAFFGMHPLNNREGFPTHAIFGFLNILRRMEEEVDPDGVCVTFDRKEPTFRHLAYADYKAQRKGMPEELAVQMPELPVLDLDRNREGLTDDQLALIRVLDTETPLLTDEAAEQTGLPVRRVLSALTVLEIDGYVCRQGARSFLRTVELKKE